MEAALLDPTTAPPSSGAEPATRVRIWTDGSCPKNPGHGGWALVVEEGGELKQVMGGGVAQTTNNIMELTGVREALVLATDLDRGVTILSDSQYVVYGLTKWVESWKQRGWVRKTRQGTQPVLNRKLWEELDSLYDPDAVTLEWVRGHVGHRFNEMADVLAGQQAAVFVGP